MNEEAVGQCPNCGQRFGSRDKLTELGDILSYKCPRCSHVVNVAVCRDILPRLDKECVVVVKWRQGRPSAQEIIAIRKLVKGLHCKSITDVAAMFRDNPNREVGRFVLGEALDLQRAGAANGLLLEIQEIEREQDVSQSINNHLL
jgi:hypothetical protein